MTQSWQNLLKVETFLKNSLDFTNVTFQKLIIIIINTTFDQPSQKKKRPNYPSVLSVANITKLSWKSIQRECKLHHRKNISWNCVKQLSQESRLLYTYFCNDIYQFFKKFVNVHYFFSHAQLTVTLISNFEIFFLKKLHTTCTHSVEASGPTKQKLPKGLLAPSSVLREI